MKKKALLLLLSVTASIAYSQGNKNMLPIIDMHVHANSVTAIGPPCDPPTELPYYDPANSWPESFTAWYSDPEHENPAATDKELMDQTLAVLRSRNIFAMTCGNFLDDYIKNGGDRIIPGLAFTMSDKASPEKIKELLSGGKYRVFGEIAIQYEGFSPSDSAFESYLKVAEDLDIPLGIHMGTGPPGAPYLPGIGTYRARLHSPLLLEEALIRHPRLRVYIMHAGWPMIDDLLALLWNHPQVYVDVGLICYAIPRAEFYAYLRRIMDSGFGKRVMYGSDQMNWPCAIESGIEAIENTGFLSEDQKRDILYNNAARFLRLSKEDIAKHHAQ